MRSGALALIPCLLLALPLPAQKKGLHFHFVDTEGGQATLIVTPSGHSIVVDAGWPGNDGRDAKRIAAAVRAAGLQSIDTMLVTHYHLDHVGGVPELAAAIPIKEFWDHGGNTETDSSAQKLEEAYKKVLATGAKRRTIRVGDTLKFGDVTIEFVTARGERIPKPLEAGGQPNPLCGTEPRKADDPTENARSIGFVLTYGKFRFVDLGDLTWNKELELACPEHFIGPVDLYLTTHHGFDQSGCKAIVHGLRPKVAIMNNGARKGGSPAAWDIVQSSPGLQDLWQLHYSVAGGEAHNVPEARIANMEAACQGHGITVDVAQDGAFTVTNLRNQQSKRYK